jgi:hypothetical protein
MGQAPWKHDVLGNLITWDAANHNIKITPLINMRSHRIPNIHVTQHVSFVTTT